MYVHDLEWLHVYEITGMSKYELPMMSKGTRIFVQRDVHDIHVFRMIPDTNRRYNHEDGVYCVEMDNLSLSNARRGMTIFDFLEKFDNYDNWENDDYDDEYDAIEGITGGWTLHDDPLIAPHDFKYGDKK